MADDDPALTDERRARPTTHVIMPDDVGRPVGRALCGRLVSITLHRTDPTCAECAAALEARDRDWRRR